MGRNKDICPVMPVQRNCNMEVEDRTVLKFLHFVIVILIVVNTCDTRKHELYLSDDTRRVVDVSTFGFFKHAMLSVKVSGLQVKNPKLETQSIGFTLDKSVSDGSASYLEEHEEPHCILSTTKDVPENDSISVVFFTFNFTNKTLDINRKGRSLSQLYILPHLMSSCTKAIHSNTTQTAKTHVLVQGEKNSFNTSFTVCITRDSEEGLYNLFFHNCNKTELSLTIDVVEMNTGKNYLSAGDIPLPTLYILMSFVYFTSSCYWYIYLHQHKDDVFKIHYLMYFLAVLKTLSLMFHAMDYHFISLEGSPMEAFAILFYITYLIKGALLFLNIALIGSGWAFVKPILSEKDKKLFIMVIPLQVFANVAYIITDTSEEGESQYATWKAVFVLVDILCCGAILYPVIWSIRHLQEAATTDGKAAISLAKLKLFRHFYILVVCYIYFTRIIVYLLKVTVPFRFMWLDDFFFELATYTFFVITAYKFRPGSDNPYLQVPSDEEDDMDVEDVLTENGATEGLTKLHPMGQSTTKAVQRDINHSTSA